MPRTKLDQRNDPFYAAKTRRVANQIIRSYMGAANMNQKELATATGIAPSTLCERLKDESKTRPWELPELVALCSVLKIGADDRARMLGG